MANYSQAKVPKLKDLPDISEIVATQEDPATLTLNDGVLSASSRDPHMMEVGSITNKTQSKKV